MAIKINNLNSKNPKGYSYVDIHFDLQEIQKDGGRGMGTSIVAGKDIVVDTNTTAIRNSLINILSTSKGQRPLLPNFGINLYSYIGSPITESMGGLMAAEIQRGITQWEPRVKVDKIYIIPNPDQYLYQIILAFTPVNLQNEQIVLTGNLAQEKGFTFIEAPVTFK
jgi:phage baseplate assembly protein W